MPNGVTLSAAEVDRLQALQPEVDRITSRVAGSRALSALGETDHKAIIAAEIDLLKKEFGDGWKKFYLIRRESASYDPKTMQIIATEAPKWIDPTENSSVASRSTLETVIAAPLVMRMSRWYHWLPWQWWNQGQTETGSYTGLFYAWVGIPASSIMVGPIVDANGTINQDSQSNSSLISRDGWIRYGLYDGRQLPCNITYRAQFTGTPGLDTGDVVKSWK